MQRLIIVFFVSYFLYAQDTNSIDSKNIKDNTEQQSLAKSSSQLLSQSQILMRLKDIDHYLNDTNNSWMKKYSNYRAYYDVSSELDVEKQEIAMLKELPSSVETQTKIASLERKIETLEAQKKLLLAYKENPYKELINPAQEEEFVPHITNPILIIQGFSYIKQLRQEYQRLENNYEALKILLQKLKDKITLLVSLKEFASQENTLENDRSIQREILSTKHILDELEATKNIFSTTLSLYEKKVDEQIQELTLQIKEQIVKGMIVGFVLVLSILVAFLMKLAIRKYITDNERAYTMSKIINVVNLSLIVLILLFAYLENVSYVITVLGFASAGLAIAMKDLFMSVLGWIVIVVGGTIHVGDRIRLVKDGETYIGDVLDVSVLRITLHEGITLLSYAEHRRAGRIVFVPNNFIFTTMIANYTHGSMKTVWDGIDITITFDSNYKKMMQICLDIAKHYAKGYTDITRKQLNLLRDRYSLRNTNVEPKVFSMIEPNGMRISLWYQTNAYAALPLRSTISGEIIDTIKNEKDIKIAYPTTTVRSENTCITDGSIPPHTNGII